jgi:Uma2 family endonuclease
MSELGDDKPAGRRGVGAWPMSVAERERAQENVVTLHGIPWATYETLRNMPENFRVRMTYHHGVLEMMSPSQRHERFAEILGRLIFVWSEEKGVHMESCRTMTFKREDIESGLEPDNCYYVQNEPRVWDKQQLDLSVDPPPDLAVEIDLSGQSARKLELYASFGVPEVWRFDGRRLAVLLLGAEGYAPADRSAAFPGFPIGEAADCLRQVGQVRELDLVRAFRRHVRGR